MPAEEIITLVTLTDRNGMDGLMSGTTATTPRMDLLTTPTGYPDAFRLGSERGYVKTNTYS